MSYVCNICGKSASIGRSQKHKRGVAGRRWKNRAQSTPREFAPNLQKKTVIVSGVRKQMLLCTKCIKRIKKFNSIGEHKEIATS